MTYAVGPRAVQLIMQFEGTKPRLVAEMCEGGAYELGWGSTYHLDGTPVKAGDTATLGYAIELRAHALANELRPVWPKLTVIPNQNQVDALACLAYNIGGTATANSSVVRFLNEGRIEDAAAAFGMWTGSNSAGPAAREVLNGTVPSKPLYREVGGRLRWLDDEGQPCNYFRRFRGLLRRHHAEGCLFLGYDWTEATKNDAIAMRTRMEWNVARGRWEDQILYQTPFSEVLDVARGYPLEPIRRAPEPAAEPPAPVAARIEKPALTLPAPIKELPAPYKDYDPNAEAKDIFLSKRFYGLWLILTGWLATLGEMLAGMPFVGQLAQMSPVKVDDWRLGVAIIASGFLLFWYGRVKAKGPTK